MHCNTKFPCCSKKCAGPGSRLSAVERNVFQDESRGGAMLTVLEPDGTCGRPSEMFGMDGELNSDRSERLPC